MSVAEHILFYSLLKGRPTAEAEEEVENMLQDLGFPHKRDELIQNLSGLISVNVAVFVEPRLHQDTRTHTTKPQNKCLKLTL